MKLAKIILENRFLLLPKQKRCSAVSQFYTLIFHREAPRAAEETQAGLLKDFYFTTAVICSSAFHVNILHSILISKGIIGYIFLPGPTHDFERTSQCRPLPKNLQFLWQGLPPRLGPVTTLNPRKRCCYTWQCTPVRQNTPSE